MSGGIEKLPDRQIQRGGETQVQAGRDLVIHTGLDYHAVQEIFELQADLLRKEFTSHALALVDERVNQLRGQVLSSLSTPELIGVFADPDFQFNILEAQRSAARSGQPEDIDLLVDLLVQRAETVESPRLKMATRMALDAVGQLSDDALLGLTVVWYGIRLFPQSATLDDFLAAMNSHLSRFSDALPADRSWLVDLGVLDCLQLGVGGISLKNFVQLIGENKAMGFTCAGMDADLAERHRSSFADVSPLLAQLIVPHPLAAGSYCLAGSNEERLRAIAAEVASMIPCDQTKLSQLLDSAVASNRYSERVSNWEDLLRSKVHLHDALKSIDLWWQDLPALQVTPAGVAIGYANLRRHIPEYMTSSVEMFLAMGG